VASAFAANLPEYRKANLFLAQTPTPPPALVAKRLPSGAAARLAGGSVSDAVADYTSITAGGFDITIDGTLEQVSGINLSTATSMGGTAPSVASLLQAAVRVATSSTETVTWDPDNDRFMIASHLTTSSSAVTFASSPTAGGGAVDISATLGLTAATYAEELPVVAAESTMAASLNNIVAFCQKKGFAFHNVTCCTDQTDDEIKAAMDWCNLHRKQFFFTQKPTSADFGTYGKGLSYTAFGVYKGQTGATGDDIADAAAMAKASVIDFTQPNGLKTMKFQQLVGVARDDINTGAMTVINAKGLNAYVNLQGFPMLQHGIATNGRWFDEVLGLAWLEDAVSTNIFAGLIARAAMGKTPQTDGGVQMIVKDIEAALADAVTCGLIAPAVWNFAGVGSVKQGEFLPKGYFIYAQPVAQQNTSDRQARKSPPITILLCGAGAIQGVQVVMNFQR
jgi:hypothetical protein